MAVSRRLPVTTVVFCDGSLNRILLKQEDKGYPPVGTLLDNPDFARVAEAFGAAGFHARTRAELRQALSAARELQGPAVIAAHVDPAEYKVQF